MKTRLLVIWAVLLAGFTGTVFAEQEWYPGIGLEVSDRFHYDACGMWDNTTCHPFEMALSVDDSIDDMWNILMTINQDGEEPLEIPMNISKNNAMLAEYSKLYHSRTYANFYSETLSHLGVYSTFENPSRLDKSPFGGHKWIGTTPAITKPSEELSLSFATLNTTPITWYHKSLKSTIWVSEDVPFPVKGEIFVPWNKTSATYQFELTEYVPNQNPCDVNNASDVRNALDNDPAVEQFLGLYPSATFEHIKTGDEPGNPRTFSEFRHDWFLLRVLVLTHDRHGVCYPVYGYAVSYDDPNSETGKILFENPYTRFENSDDAVAAIKKLSNPSNQLKSGIPVDEIECKKDLQLMQKHDGSPACVKPETKEKLEQRGWTHPCLSGMFSGQRSLCVTGSPGIGSELKPELQAISKNNILSKGTGFDLPEDTFAQEDLEQLQQRENELRKIRGSPDTPYEQRQSVSVEIRQMQDRLQYPFQTGVPYHLVKEIKERYAVLEDNLDDARKHVRFSVLNSDAISSEHHALRIGIHPQSFGLAELEIQDKEVRKYLGNEMNILYEAVSVIPN